MKWYIWKFVVKAQTESERDSLVNATGLSLSNAYRNPCCRISVCEDVEILAESEMIIPCLPLVYLDHSKIGILEPTSQFIEKSGLLVAKSLIIFQK